MLIAVAVFQQDLRRLLEQIAAVWSRSGRLSSGRDVVDTLARAVASLAEQRHGALIVIPGAEPVDSHVEGGLMLDARLVYRSQCPWARRRLGEISGEAVAA